MRSWLDVSPDWRPVQRTRHAAATALKRLEPEAMASNLSVASRTLGHGTHTREKILYMAAIQTTNEIQSLLSHLDGQAIVALQVLGINSLKSMAPTPDALAGVVIESTTTDNRHFTVITTAHRVTFDLQRTGKLVWLKEAVPYVMLAGSSRPTVRLLLANGQGFDLTEPAKTKRITVTISTRS